MALGQLRVATGQDLRLANLPGRRDEATVAAELGVGQVESDHPKGDDGNLTSRRRPR